ncbi:hypothetical protein sscle_06g051420 [Sclerotinia sclerotiorum 1980 UF-70]|uniref:Uncharacterized protein n=1 Tax=Sclerotinia sclerotiorum (strain ATCC 18683 / 1980 / Ss-1) TaxID=665079 RepID=A0A1D9Q6F0_SCLS1|nr:hypothetical protein sscle_06g051420 [Sclerotinia sclerotiorum 1980 UF-70]
MIDSSTSKFGGHSPAASDGNHCYSPSSPVNPTCAEPATTTEYREWPFQGFLKRTIIGNDTTHSRIPVATCTGASASAFYCRNIRC